jgi:hypothetical protein
MPENAVKARNPNSDLAFAVTRLKIDGQNRIGIYVGEEAEFPTRGGSSSQFVSFYEVLTLGSHSEIQML